MLRKILCLILAALMLLPLAACGEKTPPAPSNDTTAAPNPSSGETTTAAPEYPRHELGREGLPRPRRRRLSVSAVRKL